MFSLPINSKEAVHMSIGSALRSNRRKVSACTHECMRKWAYVCGHVRLCVQLCLHTSVHRLVRAKWRETNRLYAWSSWSPCERKRTTGASIRSEWTNGVREVLPNSLPSTSAHTAALNALLFPRLLDRASNSFQMNVVYLAYWLNQLLQLTGTSQYTERQIGNFTNF